MIFSVRVEDEKSGGESCCRVTACFTDWICRIFYTIMLISIMVKYAIYIAEKYDAN